jgi:hypothetical protein
MAKVCPTIYVWTDSEKRERLLMLQEVVSEWANKHFPGSCLALQGFGVEYSAELKEILRKKEMEGVSIRLLSLQTKVRSQREFKNISNAMHLFITVRNQMLDHALCLHGELMKSPSNCSDRRGIGRFDAYMVGISLGIESLFSTSHGVALGILQPHESKKRLKAEVDRKLALQPHEDFTLIECEPARRRMALKYAFGMA